MGEDGQFVTDTMGAVAANAGSTPLHLAAMKVGLINADSLYDVLLNVDRAVERQSRVQTSERGEG
jgi:hypothetical protein